jgi:hypothetical protein
MQGDRTRRQVAWALFALLTGVYLLTGKGFSEILDAEGYYLITRALVEEGEVGVVPELSSAVLRGDEPTRNGRAFLHFGVGYPIFQVPFYVVGRTVGEIATAAVPRLGTYTRFFPRAAVSVAPAVITALTAVALYFWLLQLGCGLRWSVAGGLLFGLATYAWPYAKIGFYEPFLSLCQTLSLLWAMVWGVRRQARWLVFSGFAAAWGVAAKPSLVLLVPVLAAYILAVGWSGPGRPRRLVQATVATALGMLPWVLTMMWYNAARTGAATNTGYNPGNYMPTRDMGSFAQALYGNAFAPGRAFGLYSPVAILFFLGLPWCWRHARRELIACLAIIASNYVFFALRGNWATMRPWGPRYLESLTPIFILMAVPGMMQWWPRTPARRAMQALIAVSFAVQLLAIAVPFGTWLDRVREETGSSFSSVFEWRYNPIWGQIVLLREAQLGPIEADARELTDGQPSEAFKRELRQSPDFWFAYAYRLGLPMALVVPGILLLAAAVAILAVRLRALVFVQGPAPNILDQSDALDGN